MDFNNYLNADTLHNIRQICEFPDDLNASIKADHTAHRLNTDGTTALGWGRSFVQQQFGYVAGLSGTVQVIKNTFETTLNQFDQTLTHCLHSPNTEDRKRLNDLLNTETQMLSGLNRIYTVYRNRYPSGDEVVEVVTLQSMINDCMRRITQHAAQLKQLPPERWEEIEFKRPPEVKDQHAEAPVRMHLPAPEAAPSALWGMLGSLWGSKPQEASVASSSPGAPIARPQTISRANFSILTPLMLNRMMALHAPEVEGVFRIAPSGNDLGTFTGKLESALAKMPVDPNELQGLISNETDVNVLAFAFKRIMKKVDPAWFTVADLPALQKAVLEKDANQVLAILKKTGTQVHALLQFLNAIQTPTSRLTAQSLAIVLAPSTFKEPAELEDYLAMTQATNQAVRLIIEHSEIE